jgi:hypothetical protein
MSCHSLNLHLFTLLSPTSIGSLLTPTFFGSLLSPTRFSLSLCGSLLSLSLYGLLLSFHCSSPTPYGSLFTPNPLWLTNLQALLLLSSLRRRESNLHSAARLLLAAVLLLNYQAVHQAPSAALATPAALALLFAAASTVTCASRVTPLLAAIHLASSRGSCSVVPEGPSTSMQLLMHQVASVGGVAGETRSMAPGFSWLST